MTIKIERKNGKVVGIVTKTFLKKADIFGSKEYEFLQKFYEAYPNAEIKVNPIAKNPDKKSRKNLTYVNMEVYINVANEKDVAKKLLDEFEKIKEASKIQRTPYQFVANWFEKTFPDYQNHDVFKNKPNEVENNNTNIIPISNAQ